MRAILFVYLPLGRVEMTSYYGTAIRDDSGWWVRVPAYEVDGVLFQSIGPYNSAVEAKRAWTAIKRSVRDSGDKTYGRNSSMDLGVLKIEVDEKSGAATASIGRQQFVIKANRVGSLEIEEGEFEVVVVNPAVSGSPDAKQPPGLVAVARVASEHLAEGIVRDLHKLGIACYAQPVTN